MGGCEGLSKTDGKHSSDTWSRPGDYIARTKAKATDNLAVNPDFAG